MASLTVRQLDDRLKKQLRLRAARNGRSVEDEVRTHPARGSWRQRRARRRRRSRTRRCERRAVCRRRQGNACAADHRRRHRRLQVARSHPPAEGARLCRALHSHKGGRAFRHAAVGRRDRRRARVHRSVRSGERIRRRSHPARARDRSDRGRAGDRRPDGEDGERARRRSRHRRAAGDDSEDRCWRRR